MSDYHLAVMIMPYISKKINEGSNFTTITEKNLEKCVTEIIAKINIEEQIKDKILNLGWNKNSNFNLEEIKNENIILVIGSKKFIEDTNENIDKTSIKNKKIKVINFYEMEEVNEDMIKILNNYEKILNTSGEKEINDVLKKQVS